MEAWYAAARVLNFAVRAEATLADPPRASEGALDGEVRRTAQMLREREHENVRGAAILLGLANEKDR